MRVLAVFVLGAVAGLPFAAAGCRSGGTPAAAVADPPPDGVDAGAGAEDEGGVAVADHVHVSGLVATDLGEPVAGRAVVLVDAEGARRAIVTAGDGSFGVDGVALPYDVAVAGSPPAVFLGAERLEAAFEVGEPGGPAVMPPSQTVRIGVRAPGCPALRPVCSVTVVTASGGGGGFARVPCAARAQDADTASAGGSSLATLAPTILSVVHAWRVLPLAGDSVAVHALVRCDAAGGGGQGSVDAPPRAGDGGEALADGAFAYGRVDGVPPAPGSLSDAGMMDAVVVASTAPVTFGARGDTDELAPWLWTTAVRLDLAGARGGTGEGESGFVFATAEDPATTLRLPNVRGAAVRVEVRAEHPRNDPSGGFFRSAEAWSGAMPVITSTPAGLLGVDLVAGPDLLAPESGTPLSADQDFSWQGGGAALATLAVADSSRGIQCFRVSTDDEDIANGRLEALGLPPLGPGPHLVALTTYPKSSLADATSPDPAVRRRRFDRTQRGAATYLREPFDVAP